MVFQDKINSMLQEYIKITKQMQLIEARMKARAAVLRQEIKEVTSSFEEEFNTAKKQKNKIRDEILGLWDDNFGKKTTVAFESAVIVRRNLRELVVHNKCALVNVLDRIGRLDLVDYVFKENEVAKLYAQGKLKGLTKKRVETIDHFELQVRPNKEEYSE